VLAEYDLSIDTDDLISNGLKKGVRFGNPHARAISVQGSQHDTNSKGKTTDPVKRSFRDLQCASCEDAGMVATLDDVELDRGHARED
jgi:hypothetical protein